MKQIKMEKAEKKWHLALAGEITIERAGELKASLEEALDNAETLSINMNAVEAADLSLLQLLYAAKLTATKKGKTLALDEGCPLPVSELVEAAGLNWQNAFFDEISCKPEVR